MSQLSRNSNIKRFFLAYCHDVVACASYYHILCRIRNNHFLSQMAHRHHRKHARNRSRNRGQNYVLLNPLANPSTAQSFPDFHESSRVQSTCLGFPRSSSSSASSEVSLYPHTRTGPSLWRQSIQRTASRSPVAALQPESQKTWVLQEHTSLSHIGCKPKRNFNSDTACAESTVRYLFDGELDFADALV